MRDPRWMLVLPPVKVLVPVRITEPPVANVRLPVPLIAPLNVRTFVPEPVTERLFPKDTPWEMLIVPGAVPLRLMTGVAPPFETKFKLAPPLLSSVTAVVFANKRAFRLKTPTVSLVEVYPPPPKPSTVVAPLAGTPLGVQLDAVFQPPEPGMAQILTVCA